MQEAALDEEAHAGLQLGSAAVKDEESERARRRRRLALGASWCCLLTCVGLLVGLAAGLGGAKKHSCVAGEVGDPAQVAESPAPLTGL